MKRNSVQVNKIKKVPNIFCGALKMFHLIVPKYGLFINQVHYEYVSTEPPLFTSEKTPGGCRAYTVLFLQHA